VLRDMIGKRSSTKEQSAKINARIAERTNKIDIWVGLEHSVSSGDDKTI